MNTELIAYIVAQALQVYLQAAAEFARVNGRPPTLEEWKQLEGKWRSPDEIEAAIRARLAAQGPSPLPSAGS